jgi:hypothetical protein
MFLRNVGIYVQAGMRSNRKTNNGDLTVVRTSNVKTGYVVRTIFPVFLLRCSVVVRKRGHGILWLVATHHKNVVV